TMIGLSPHIGQGKCFDFRCFAPRHGIVLHADSADSADGADLSRRDRVRSSSFFMFFKFVKKMAVCGEAMRKHEDRRNLRNPRNPREGLCYQQKRPTLSRRPPFATAVELTRV